MDKFKKAIEQLNKPINEMNKNASRPAKNSKKDELKKTLSSETVSKPVKDMPEQIQAEAAPAAAEYTERREIITAEKAPAAELKYEQSEPEAKPSVTEPETEIKPEQPEAVLEPEAEIEQLKAAPEPERADSGNMTEFEKELEKEFISTHPDTKAVLKMRKQKEKKEKKENKKKTKKREKNNKKTAEGVKAAKPKEKTTKKRGIASFVAIAAAVLIVAGIAANYNLNNQLKPVFYQLQSGKVIDNVRVVAISDMHLKEFGENNIRLVDKIKSYHPDIIAIVGDMNIDSNPDYSAVLNLCARLNEVAPLYYALGNHEFEAMLFEDSQIYYDLKAAGITVLNNETETIEVGLSTIDVIGLTQGPNRFREDAKKFFENAMEADDNFKLVLTHYPENFMGVIEEYPIDLAICGHAHGGQIRLPVIGGLYSSDQGFLPKLCDGYHEIENSKVIITKGLGRSGVVPRINNPPEITIIDINWY